MVHHLEKLINGEAVDIPVYDFATHLRRTDQTIRLEPRPVILVEGILILHEVALRRLVRA
jgi:uridine kinase